MLYRGIEYSVVLGIERYHGSGLLPSRGRDIQLWQHAEAISYAEKAIDRAIQKQRFKQNLDGED
jgi:hypothetical protein